MKQAHFNEGHHATREGWLIELVSILRPRLSNLGYGLPDNIRIACGFPSTRGLSISKRRIGECWAPEAAADGTINIFISPVLDDPLVVAETVVHELGHASLGESGHLAPFRAYMRTLGLTGKPTATEAGPELRGYLTHLLEDLGDYANSRIDKTAGPEKKQSTRMAKISCSNEHEAYILRGSKATFAKGIPDCPVCGKEMEPDEPEDAA